MPTGEIEASVDGRSGPFTISNEVLEELRSEIKTTRAPLRGDQSVRLLIAKGRTKRTIGELIREGVEMRLRSLNL